MKKILIFGFVALCMLVGAFDATAARTTRDLVFDDGDDAAKTKSPEAVWGEVIAVKTTVVLNRGGTTQTVLPTYEFKSGDSIKLVFTANVDGYVYWMTKGTSGNYSVLFPNAKAGTDNAVKRNQEYTVPVKGIFRFDDKAGKEELLCILSTEKLPDIETIIATGSGSAVAALEEKNSSQRKTRDLVFDDDDSNDVNTKKQSAAKGVPFVALYVLTHN